MCQLSYADVFESEKQAYLEEMTNKVYRFADLNRFNMGNINMDIYADCYMQVGVEMKIDKNGMVKDISIIEPAPVAIVNKYFSYAVSHSRPLIPLAKYFDKDVSDVVIFERFRLKLNINEDSSDRKPCA